MPVKKKLHVETLLYQMKRLLLKSNSAAMSSDSSSVQSFTELLLMVYAACSEEYQQDVLATVTDRIDVMLWQLDQKNTPCDNEQGP
ncbi:hypothetical protein M1B72_13455 [Geomonas paludis]|uniref:Uncharacterized protein n=1 Tax=Geomonas paludis TaxID=2740185 RepID=A0A6V8MY36_9BACT|nr:hypothetical protein [Geomonas paludis]UPU34455.1 hypothetical protein M1B72_13455 [Geomonas paludis]GFO64443.1 hypothetical protein GMPD_23620 [Geomonas paludis]